MINRPPAALPIGAEWLNALPQGPGWTPPAAFAAQPVREVHFRTVQGRTSGQSTQVVEWLYALVSVGHLGQGTATNAQVRTWVQQEVGRSTDDAGHIIGNNQGGLGTVQWNIFPQSSNFNRGVFSRDVERMIHDAASHGQVRIWFRFNYTNAAEPGRPTNFHFFILFPDGATMNNDLVNP